MNFYNLAIRRGQVPNFSVQEKFGFNPLVGSTKETVWPIGGIIGFPSTASVMNVSSDDATDAAGDVGLRTVTVFGLDGDFNLASDGSPVEETVTMDGQTIVTTTQVFARVIRMIGRTAGGSETNVGMIYAFTGTATVGTPDDVTQIYAAIPATEGQTLQASYTIPAGHDGFMTRISGSSFGNQNVSIAVRVEAREPGGIFVVKERFFVSRNNMTIEMDEALPPFAPMTDIMITGESSGVAGDLSSTFVMLLVKR